MSLFQIDESRSSVQATIPETVMDQSISAKASFSISLYKTNDCFLHEMQHRAEMGLLNEMTEIRSSSWCSGVL